MKKILVVGLTCVDIKTVVKQFPVEDSDSRAESQTWTIGGNAANTSRVLVQHPHVKVFLYSGLSSLSQHSFAINELQETSVDISLCALHDNLLPTATCILNLQTASRTILCSSNQFPPLRSSHFMQNINYRDYDWIHFEGRDFPDVGEMIQSVINARVASGVSANGFSLPVVSAEMEKVKRLDDLEKYVLPYVDILFISKDIARAKGFTTALETVRCVSSNSILRATIVVCAWGEAGAAGAQFRDGKWTYSECGSASCGTVVDTLGAGDTFNAGVIYSLVRGFSCEDAIWYGCQLAGKKCTQMGFDNLIDDVR